MKGYSRNTVFNFLEGRTLFDAQCFINRLTSLEQYAYIVNGEGEMIAERRNGQWHLVKYVIIVIGRVNLKMHLTSLDDCAKMLSLLKEEKNVCARLVELDTGKTLATLDTLFNIC